MAEIYLDDLAPGQIHRLGRRMLGRDEIVAFARDWDPQSFHLDEQAAAASIYGGLIASGWHTVCVFMRLFVDGMLGRAAALGSPGIDELRWLKPVRPGDALRLRTTVIEATPSAKHANRGTVLFLWETLNQNGEVVLSMRGRQMYLRRTPA
jgi:acyl dehydratase